MKELLNGQLISIDSHHANVPLNWDSSQQIHLHKRNNKTDNWYNIRIPLNSNDNPVYEDKQDKSNTIPSNILKELKKAFDDPKKRESFVKEVVNAINNCKSKKLSKFEQSKQALLNVQKAFGLHFHTKAIKEIKGWVRNSLKLYAMVYEAKQTHYYISVFNGIITIGELSPESLAYEIGRISTSKNEKIRFEFNDIESQDE